ncbi:MAG: potassium-transporting ATPase subunit KdpA, partial [Alphaproteobacteria bacterium]|nr:potassium-transporting ATPase subunit KdpA [Alphaproteobacteria bacterium]
MTVLGWAQIALFVVILAALTRPFGGFVYRVVQGERTWLSPMLAPVERVFYGLAGIDPKREQSWKDYALGMLAFNLCGIVLVYALQRLQAVLPLNPQDMAGVAPDLAFNTAVSFVTNTNWQNYGGESTMSYLTQMVALTVQNFVSAATGVSIAVALSR